MSEEPFFTREGSSFITQPACRGPRDPKSLNGRVVVALCGFQIEQSHELADYMPARLTVDMYRLPGFAPIQVKTHVVRDGTRIKVIDAKFISVGVSYARATSQWLKRSQNAGQYLEPAELGRACARNAAGAGEPTEQPDDHAPDPRRHGHVRTKARVAHRLLA
jgi:hypothetical protein